MKRFVLFLSVALFLFSFSFVSAFAAPVSGEPWPATGWRASFYSKSNPKEATDVDLVSFVNNGDYWSAHGNYGWVNIQWLLPSATQDRFHFSTTGRSGAVTFSGNSWIQVVFRACKAGGLSNGVMSIDSILSASVRFGSSTILATADMSKDWNFQDENGWVTIWYCVTNPVESPASGLANYFDFYTTKELWSNRFTDVDIQSVTYFVDTKSDTVPPLDVPLKPPTESDQWLDEQYEGANNPALGEGSDKIKEDVGQIESFEDGLWNDAAGYESQIDVGNFSISPQFVTAITWVSTAFVSLFDQLGSWKAVVTFPMLVGLALLIIGRGTQAMNSTSLRVQRESAYKAGYNAGFARNGGGNKDA